MPHATDLNLTSKDIQGLTSADAFADHYLLARLREDPAWGDNPNDAFQQVKQLLRDARGRWLHQGEAVVREQLFEPLFRLLGFDARVNKGAEDARTAPDYLLTGRGGQTAAFVYAWDRWLDGPDFNVDQHTPEENPGACVVTALDEGTADWIIMTNGRQWRLYSRHAHSRATNFYEVDLAEALVASGDTDPNEAFRYWWLFFRAAAFAPAAGRDKGCWLDTIAEGSRQYARQLGERLKQRIFETIFPHLAQGFLEDRRHRLGVKRKPTDEELHDAFEATLTLLYRLLFLLYAESRDLLPIREAPYRQASLTKIKEEIAEKAGIAETEAAARLAKAYSATETTLYDRLQRLCAAMDRGDPSLNVPTYNGGLFVTNIPHPPPGEGRGEGREQRIARFLAEHKVPDRFLAPAIDRLARDPDDKTLALVFIDYKSLEVRHLGSIYEGLLEFKLRMAEEDLTTKTEKGKEKFIPLAAAKPKRGKAVEVIVRKGEVYLSNDKAERKASGSYYTPDPIVEYIVEQTVGPVLAEKLESLRADLRSVRKTFDNELAKLKVPPLPEPVRNGAMTARDFAAGKTYQAHRGLVERVFDFRALDPAMGSGHFLVEAVDFITDRLLTFLNQFPVNPVSFMLDRTRRNILDALGEQGIAVDPDKLAEVNLLKRHVLKRCIYGVDLNPMAVELAKVSLWLDAFTIGAPLSFLDHHLRCGNSLVGATFNDLEVATEGQLFGIDYQPLLRAIRHVIQVNQMADATAAEVKHSASEYNQARRDLSGYQIVLDLLAARHFGLPKAAGLLEFGNELDLSNRDRFVASLRQAAPTKKDETPAVELVEQVEDLARRPDHCFFHWEIEFPEVFFGFADLDGRIIKHKDKIAAGTAGFDAVVGNPPYLGVRTGSFAAAFTRYVSTAYATAERNWDIFSLFIERGLRLVCSTCRLGVIVPSRVSTNRDFLGLRRKIFAQRGPLELIECGAAFDDPSVLASILILRIPPIGDEVLVGEARDGIPAVRRAIPRNLLESLPDSPFVTPLQEEQVPVFARLCELASRLGDVAEITRGMECGKNDSHVTQLNGSGLRPVISGEGVREFVIRPQGLYMPRDLQPLAKYKPQLFDIVPRIVLRFVAPYPIAAIDQTGFMNFNTVYNVVLHSGGLDECAVLACLLNSSAIRWWFRTAFNADESLFPHIQKYQLAAIPLPELSLKRRVFRQLARIGHAAVEGSRPNRDQLDQLTLEALGLDEFAAAIPQIPHGEDERAC